MSNIIFEISPIQSNKNANVCHCSRLACNRLILSSYITNTFRNSRFKMCGISSLSTTSPFFKWVNRHTSVKSCRLFIGKCTVTLSRVIEVDVPNRTGRFLTCNNWPVQWSMNIHGCATYVFSFVPSSGFIAKKITNCIIRSINLNDLPPMFSVSPILNGNRSNIRPPYGQFHSQYINMQRVIVTISNMEVN